MENILSWLTGQGSEFDFSEEMAHVEEDGGLAQIWFRRRGWGESIWSRGWGLPFMVSFASILIFSDNFLRKKIQTKKLSNRILDFQNPILLGL